MIIRWLEAYGGYGNDFFRMLRHEFGEQTKAVCAEKLTKGKSGLPERVRVGLLFKNSAVVRRFKEDVFSVRNEQGYLRKTRKGCGGFGTHTELWVRPGRNNVCGIVVRDKWASISPERQKEIRKAAEMYYLPVFILANGQLNKMEVVVL